MDSIKSGLFLVALVVFAVGCGSMSGSGENYGNLFDNPDGITLTEATHSDGWQRSDCTTCHNLNNIHLTDRSGSGIDVAAIQQETFDEGESVCSSCHGNNGL